MQAWRTLLSNNKRPFNEKSVDEEFDVQMRCFDGAVVCELVGFYILHLLRTVMRKEKVDLNRDDGLGILWNFSGSEIERNTV